MATLLLYDFLTSLNIIDLSVNHVEFVLCGIDGFLIYVSEFLVLWPFSQGQVSIVQILPVDRILLPSEAWWNWKAIINAIVTGIGKFLKS